MPSGAYYLRNLGLLEGLPEGACRLLEQQWRVHHYGRRETIVEQGAPADQVHLLAEGSAELVRREQEKETILVVLSPGEFIMGPVEDATAGSLVCARALDECAVCTIGQRELEAIIQMYPMLAWRLLTWSSRNTEQAYSRIQSLASCEVTDKLLALIRHLAGRHGVPTADGLEITLRLTHHDLAALIGSCREAVSRGLKALRDRGVIAVNARCITLRESG
ncbi:MAG TPA: Crp/Fnr family transcriptional regulator [Armatimonadota bacterium]|jgi:CRP/FNR family cyclic AMP-dependent transcriptional regulator|nr:Crp/Fnr family transcriptional regulator [Armatimonadota bacterium]HOJ21009.1 Crp/Fnr family transcriptional regulator [Armatimonadota bacterium]HOM83554.1 Crp/Fnr family transcriptional regulator [Armatimonadota bacterium]HOQ30296.1 Crp/Fnr family transcriptional regulator [Armatimonadota bacterium]HPO74296.1 Crp/Fnr family transcriptional regulator [Armatimonadota bacterium]